MCLADGKICLHGRSISFFRECNKKRARQLEESLVILRRVLTLGPKSMCGERATPLDNEREVNCYGDHFAMGARELIPPIPQFLGE